MLFRNLLHVLMFKKGKENDLQEYGIRLLIEWLWTKTPILWRTIAFNYNSNISSCLSSSLCKLLQILFPCVTTDGISYELKLPISL